LNVTIGTPPQSFYFILSLVARDVFVISTRLKDRKFRARKHYDSSLSSTYIPNSTHLNATFILAKAGGPVAIDSMKIGPIVIPSQQFIETDFLQGSGFYLDGISYDGMIGLGSDAGMPASGNKNIVLDMWERGLIGRPIFELTLARHLQDAEMHDYGELVLGGSEVNENLKMIPFLNRKMPDHWSWDWIGYSVEANSVSVGDNSSIKVTMKNGMAQIETELILVLIPTKISEYMDALMDVKEAPFDDIYRYVDCKKRNDLPDLVFNLGGIEVRLSPWAYMAESREGGTGWASCISLLGNSFDDNAIALGNGFLRGVRMVVDVEKNALGCKWLKPFNNICTKC